MSWCDTLDGSASKPNLHLSETCSRSMMPPQWIRQDQNTPTPAASSNPNPRTASAKRNLNVMPPPPTSHSTEHTPTLAAPDEIVSIYGDLKDEAAI